MTETLKRNRRPTAPGLLLKELFLTPRGIVHKEFAADIEISEKQLSLIVNGRRMMPVVAGRIAKALNWNLAMLRERRADIRAIA